MEYNMSLVYEHLAEVERGTKNNHQREALDS